MNSILKQLKNKIIVSCQPNEGGPQDDAQIIISMAKTAILGGCGGVRIEGAKNIREVKKNISLPVIGIIKNGPNNNQEVFFLIGTLSSFWASQIFILD